MMIFIAFLGALVYILGVGKDEAGGCSLWILILGKAAVHRNLYS
jgi:hypothetical protein